MACNKKVRGEQTLNIASREILIEGPYHLYVTVRDIRVKHSDVSRNGRK